MVYLQAGLKAPDQDALLHYLSAADASQSIMCHESNGQNSNGLVMGVEH